MPDTSLMFTGAAAATLGAIFWFVELRKEREHRAWCEQAAKVDGVVSRIADRGHPTKNERIDEDIVSAPVVTFRAANGAEYEFDAPGISAKVGEQVTVAYDRLLPSNARLLDRPRKPGCVVILIVGGLLLAGYAWLKPS